MSNRESPLTTSRAALHGLTVARLRDVLRYVHETGDFLRTTDRGARKAGTKLGTLDPAGYRTIAVDGVNYKAHRLAVLYMTGEMPPSCMPVDHLNRERDDNRWENLRVCSAKENIANQARPGAYSKTPYSIERAWSAPTADGIALIRAGVPIGDAALRAGVTRETLVRVCKRLNIAPPAGSDGRKEQPETTRGVELIRGGMTLREVAGLLGLAPSTLVRACKRAKLVLPRGRPRAPRPVPPRHVYGYEPDPGF